MGKYSSDSISSGDDSRDSHRRKKNSSRGKGRSRSSSETSSSDSRHSNARKRSRKKRKCKSRRSRSRDRKTKSSRSRRNRSGDDRSRSSLRSRSWSRSRSNSKSRSPTPSSRRPRSYRRSPSSGSQDSHSKADGKGSKSASSSREAVPSNNTGTSSRSSEDQLSAKLQAAIRAAQSADQLLRQQGVLLPPPQSTNSTSVQPKASQPSTNRVIVVSDHNDPAALDEINAPGFVQHNFISNGRAETSSEQAAGIISTVVSATLASKSDSTADKDSLFHPNLLVNSQVKMDKWVKKLFTLRQKAINGEPLV